MADKRDLKIKTHKHMAEDNEPSPLAWENSQKKRTPRAKKKAERKVEVSVTDSTAALTEAVPRPRRKKRRSGGVRLLVRIVAFLAAAAVVLSVWRNWDSLAPSNLVFWIDQTFSTKGDGYPVEISGNSVLDMQEVQSYLVLLTDTSLVALNASGGEVMRRQHNYSDPILLTNGKYMLVAEIGGKRFRLETMPDTLLNVTADNLSGDKKTQVLDAAVENAIISAAVRSDGTVALVTESSQSYTSEVLVYSSSGKRIYRQRYVSMMATDVALSPDEKDIAVTGIEAQNGVMRSLLRVHALNAKDTTPRKEYTGEGIMLSRVAYLSDGQIAAIGDTQAWVVDADSTLDQRISYHQQLLVGYTIGEKMIGLAMQKYGAGDGGEIMRLNSKGETVYTAAFSGAFRHVYAHDSDLLLLTSGQLYRGNEEKLYGGMDVPQDGRMAGLLGDKAIVLGLTTLSEYSLS